MIMCKVEKLPQITLKSSFNHKLERNPSTSKTFKYSIPPQKHSDTVSLKGQVLLSLAKHDA